MLAQNFFRGLKLVFLCVFGIFMIIGCDNCDSGTDPIVQPNFRLDIDRYNNAAPEVFIDSSLIIKGDLFDLGGTKLANYKIHFLVIPDSLGNMSPPDYTLTNPGSETGFLDRVTFIARRPGQGMIYGRYYLNDILAASDTLHVLVKRRGNE